jgi:D-3-phosphoglycerate dehydrogenase
MGKTLGVLGFGRIGQLVAARARAFDMEVLAFDPFVGPDRYRELGVEKADSSDDVYARADFITVHLPNTPETKGWLDAEAFAKMRDGVRVINVARGGLIVDTDLQAAVESGKVGGAALDVFASEPITEHPLFGHPRVVVTPHLGASTAEANDRAGFQVAEQMVAALTGGSVTTAVNAPAVRAEDAEVLGPFVPLCRSLGRLAVSLAESAERVEVELLGRIAERDVRPLGLAVLRGVLDGRTEEDVNDVNAPLLAEERGIQLSETTNVSARDFTDLVRVSVDGVLVAGTTIGRRERPHLLEVWGQRFNVQLEGHVALFRYRDVPGMIGRVGTVFGEAGVNIASAAVGHGETELAVMVVTSDEPIPAELIDRIVGLDDFVDGRAVSLT